VVIKTVSCYTLFTTAGM